MHYRYSHPELFEGVERPDFGSMSGRIVIYGAGLTGLLTAFLLDKQKIKVRCFIDRDERKQGTKYYDLPVISPEEMKDRFPDSYVIVTPTVFWPAWYYIRDDLKIKNLFTPFSLFLEFDSEGFDKLPDIPLWYRDDSLDFNVDLFMLRCINVHTDYNLTGLELSVSEVCNLRCKYCNALMPCYEKPKSLKLDDVLRDIDAILYKRNLYHINIEGGEPFLWKQLPNLIFELNKRPEIMQYIIPITNGTVMPSEELLEALKLNKVRVKISDYGNLSRKKELIKILETNGIKYWVQLQKWYALESLSKEPFDDETYIKVIDGCCKATGISNCYTFDGKLYVCPEHANYHKLGIFPSREGEYVNLRSGNKEDIKTKLDQFINAKRRYKPLPELCRHCKGRGFIEEEVPPAEQLAPGEKFVVRFE